MTDSPPYTFAAFQQALGSDWLADDPLLRRWLERARLDDESRRFVETTGRDAATRFRSHAEFVERPENLPRLVPPGLGPPTADDVLVPPETRRALAEVHGSGLWRPALNDRARYAAAYLWAQNGEFGVLCSVACTDGLARALRALGHTERERAILTQIEQATPDAWVHGAQFVTEIQGGSDAAANRVRAEPETADRFRLHGQKWFCSNLTADYWLVTARPSGAPDGPRGVGLFLAPRRWEGRPNGHYVERLKDKVGTRALPTAELQFTGARAWALGPLDRGLKNMVAIVLTTSRVHNAIAAAALVRSAVRHARAYAHFREAFGRRLEDHPLVAASLERLENAADRTEAGALATVDAWLSTPTRGAAGFETWWPRVLVSLAKAVTARRAPQLVYEAMMLLGGNGIEERFSAMSRLWRDAAIFETWEGPYTLLLMQALEDLARSGAGGQEAAFLKTALGEFATPDLVTELATILRDPQATEAARRWGALGPRIYERFEEKCLAALQTAAPTPSARHRA